MEITARFVNGVAVLDLSGHFVVSPGESEILPLRSIVRTLVADGHRRVALNLAGLASIDARGLGELAFVFTTLRHVGGDLTLIAPTPKVRKMLAVTKLDGVLPLRESESQTTDGNGRVFATLQGSISAAWA